MSIFWNELTIQNFLQYNIKPIFIHFCYENIFLQVVNDHKTYIHNIGIPCNGGGENGCTSRAAGTCNPLTGTCQCNKAYSGLTCDGKTL